MTNEALVPSLKKIERAKSKFDHLKAGIDAYIASDPYSIRRKLQNGRAYIISRREKDIPSDFAWETVEAVGHLRSALDKMLVALVESNDRGTSSVGFPFGGMSNGKPDPFPTARMDAVKKKLTADQWNLVAAQKPYPGGNDLLWAVNEIANEDKHRKELVELTPMLAENFTISGIFEGFNRNVPEDQAFADDQELERVLMSYCALRSQGEINCSRMPFVVFGKIRPVTGKNVLVTLNQQIRLVENIVMQFRSRFF